VTSDSANSQKNHVKDNVVSILHSKLMKNKFSLGVMTTFKEHAVSIFNCNKYNHDTFGVTPSCTLRSSYMTSINVIPRLTNQGFAHEDEQSKYLYNTGCSGFHEYSTEYHQGVKP
jgi:hypothetical protein